VRILVLGASGMLGNAIFRYLSADKSASVYGSIRGRNYKNLFPPNLISSIIDDVDVENFDSVVDIFIKLQPTIVVNCIGLVKQLEDSEMPLKAIPINSMLPHRIAKLCQLQGARFIHFSTDCVFSGAKGNYSEWDFPDANDLYGRTKLLGEVDYTHAITLRTSIIGHEIIENRSLIGWFLSQSSKVKGYRQAIFSGLPTVEVASVIRDYVIPRMDLRGVYHLSANPINKYDLLCKVSMVYGKNIEIDPYDDFVIDRSLDSSRFRNITGYSAPEWGDLIEEMYNFG